MAYVYVEQNHYLPVSQQKCYLETPNDNQAIIACLEKAQQAENEACLYLVGGTVLILVIGAILIQRWINKDTNNWRDGTRI